MGIAKAIKEYKQKSFFNHVKEVIQTEFSSDYYLENYNDINPHEVDPLWHYISYGWKEARDPNPNFSTEYYLKSNPDVKASGLNPFYHYLFFGKNEGRSPNEIAEQYNQSSKKLPLNRSINQHSSIRMIRESGLFDEEFYINQSPDLKQALGIDAITHYCNHGWKEGREISSGVDDDFYLRMFPEYCIPGINPMINWLFFGKDNGLPRTIDQYINRSDEPVILFVINSYTEEINSGFIERLINWFSKNTYIPFKIVINNSWLPEGLQDQKYRGIFDLAGSTISDSSFSKDFRKFCDHNIQLIYSFGLPDMDLLALLEGMNKPIIIHSTKETNNTERLKGRNLHFLFTIYGDNDALSNSDESDISFIKEGDFQLNEIIKLIRNKGNIAPLVSVLVPNFNYADFLPKRLETIINQTFQDFEVVIIDDSSTDNSRLIFDEYSDHPFVRVILNEKNSGNVFSQWKTGINHLNGKIVWIAEADDFCDYDFLHQLLPAFNDRDVNLSYSNSHTINEQGDTTGDYYDYYESLDSDHWRKSHCVYGNTEINFGLGIKNTIPNTSAVLFRKVPLSEALKSIPDNFVLSGDWYTYLSVLGKNSKISFNSKKLNYHRKHKKSVTSTIHEVENKHRIVDELITLHQYILTHFELLPGYISKWEEYLNGQIRSLYPETKKNSFDGIYPYENNLKKIEENIEIHRKQTVVLVTHSSDLTGAPQIILSIAKRLHSFYGLECITFCLEKGDLFPEFEQCGKAFMINNDCTIDKTAISISDYILALPSKPLFAMANTIVSGITIPQLKKSAIPIAFLIHDYTHPMDWRYLMYSYELSDVIIYPSEFMVKKNHHDYRFNLEKTFVLPQGLYKEEFLNIPRSQESRARIRKELSIPDDAIVLFGNGSVDHRKGVDIFLTLGLNLLSNFSFEKEIHFVWLGGTIGKPYKDEYHKFLSRDLLNSSFENHFHFVKATKNVKPYYDASDIFILTSREDPFPSVVQEAIASGLHIAGFDGTGGAIELIKKAGGLVFPFQNIKLAVEELNVLIRSMKDQNERLTNAKRIIKEEYNFSTYVDNIVGLLIEKMHLQNNETLVNKNNIAK